MATVTLTRGTTLPDSSAKSDFHNLVDTATGTVTNIVNADIDSAAAIADTKLATISTAQKVNLSALVATSQATGDIHYSSSSTVNTRLPIGSAGQALIVSGGLPAWGTAFTPSSSNALAGSVVQVVTTETASTITCATTGTTHDDTIPAITDGVQILSRTITPTNASNILYFLISGNGFCDSGANTTVHLHKDGASAVAATSVYIGNHSQNFILTHSEAAGSTSSQTWTVRLNPSNAGNTVTLNGGTAGARIFGGVSATKITIIEVKV